MIFLVAIVLKNVRVKTEANVIHVMVIVFVRWVLREIDVNRRVHKEHLVTCVYRIVNVETMLIVILERVKINSIESFLKILIFSFKGECNSLSCNGDAKCLLEHQRKRTSIGALCPEGFYGPPTCRSKCLCMNNAPCDALTGRCLCHSGHVGKYCERCSLRNLLCIFSFVDRSIHFFFSL